MEAVIYMILKKGWLAEGFRGIPIISDQKSRSVIWFFLWEVFRRLIRVRVSLIPWPRESRVRPLSAFPLRGTVGTFRKH
jgi:hypothetical protein